jgi:hypothetical protein
MMLIIATPIGAKAPYQKQKETQIAQNIENEITYEPKKVELPVWIPYYPPVVSNALAVIIKRESGDNMYAVNSIGACGLGQSLPCSKMLNWLGKTSLSETTYDDQVEWVEHYINGRYGNVDNALDHENEFGWY